MKKILLLVAAFALLINLTDLLASPSFYAVNWQKANSEIRKNNISVYGIIGDQALISLESDIADKLKNSKIELNLLDQSTNISDYYFVSKRDHNKPVVISRDVNILLKSGDQYLVKVKSGLAEIYGQNFDILQLWNQPMVLPSADKLIAPILDKKNKSQPIVDLISKVNSDSVLSYLKYLQSMQTRFTHADNRRNVAEKIKQKFIELGCTTAELDSFFVPAYSLSYYNLVFPDSWQYNVVATITGSEEPNNYILITGHHDCFVNQSVAGQNPYILAPGVDDNGTSVAAAWEICRVIKKENYQPKKSIRFITFTAEETGLLGSKNYAQKAFDSGMQIAGVINNDMIGNNSMSQSNWRIRILPYTGSEAFNNLTLYITKLYTTITPHIDTHINSLGSDSYSFYQKGYQASYFFEEEMTPYYHSNGDTWDHIDLLYCCEAIRAGFALATHKSEAPSDVVGLEVKDKGNGTELMVNWHQSNVADLNHYKISIGTSSGEYTNTITTTDTFCTVSGLTNNQLYYIGISAVNNSNYESMITESSGTPRLAPLPPVNVSVESLLNGVRISWNANTEPDIAGYHVLRSSDNISFTNIDQYLITETGFVDNNTDLANYRYYKVTAVDNDGNESEFSASSQPVRPVTLNQGIMLVDESANGSGTQTSPDDAQQDQFFSSLLTNCPQVSSYDAQSSGKISLSELGPYSTVIWHNQSTGLGSVLNRNQNVIKKYLDFGGKILITADKPGKLIESCNNYPTDFSSSSIAELYFGIDSVNYKIPSLFSGAIPTVSGFNYLTVDSNKAQSVNGFHIKKIETLKNKPYAEVIYKYDSKYSTTESYGYSKNQPVGIINSGSNFKTATLAVPLYFIKQNEAKKVVEYILRERFGETVDIKDNSLLADKLLFLEQNYPNPFNNTTAISFTLPKSGIAELKVYNAKGELVKELLNQELSAGKHSVMFKADNLNSGVYFYRLNFGGQIVENKLVLIK